MRKQFKEFAVKHITFSDRAFEAELKLDNEITKMLQWGRNEISVSKSSYLISFIDDKIIPLFIRFMKEHDLWDEYYYNSNNANEYWDVFPTSPVEDFISSPFDWHDSELWANLDDEWREFLERQFEIKLT